MAKGERREAVHNRIVDLVVAGELPIEHRLSEVRLAQLMGVSRTPVREAVAQLVREGAIEVKPQVGLWIKRVLDPEMKQLLQIGEAVESLVARDFADRDTTEWFMHEARGRFAALSDIHPSRLLEAVTEDDVLQRDIDLHRLVAEAAGHEQAARIISLNGLKRRIFHVEHPLGVEGTRRLIDSDRSFIENILQASDSTSAEIALRAYYNALYTLVGNEPQQLGIPLIKRRRSRKEREEPRLLSADELLNLIEAGGPDSSLKVRTYFTAENESGTESRTGWTVYREDLKGTHQVVFYRDPRTRGAIDYVLPVGGEAGRFAEVTCLFETVPIDEITDDEAEDIRILERRESLPILSPYPVAR